MWLVKNACASHSSTAKDVGPLALLPPDPAAGSDEQALLLTSDPAVVACAACSARPFTILHAEKLGFRSSPPIPKKCIWPRRPCSKNCVLESLELSHTLEEFELQVEHYVNQQVPRSSTVEWLSAAVPSEVAFCEVVDFDHALRGLKRRLRSCGLCPKTILRAELQVFPLLFWHVCHLGAESAEEALVVAMRLLAHLGKAQRREQPLPPFEAMPDSVREVVAMLYAETRDVHFKRDKRAARRRREALIELEQCHRLLGLRGDVELFNRDAYLDWGDSCYRPCCGFHFMNTRGCAACEAAFVKGRELNALKMDPPKWEALAHRKDELRNELHFLLFEASNKTLQTV